MYDHLKNELLLPAFLQEVGKFVISQVIQEEKKTEDEENTYSYTQKCSDKVINSYSFTEKEGHTNPNRFPYEKKDIYARNVKLGNYQLSEYQIIRMNDKAVYGYKSFSAIRLGK